jgi:hypothetical protein
MIAKEDLVVRSDTAPSAEGHLDESRAGSLPAPVELGQRVHFHRALAPRHASRRRGADLPFRPSVEERKGAPHRLQPRGAARQLLPRGGALGLRRGLPRCAALSSLHELPLPTSRSRHRRAYPSSSTLHRFGPGRSLNPCERRSVVRRPHGARRGPARLTQTRR